MISLVKVTCVVGIFLFISPAMAQSFDCFKACIATPPVREASNWEILEAADKCDTAKFIGRHYLWAPSGEEWIDGYLEIFEGDAYMQIEPKFIIISTSCHDRETEKHRVHARKRLTVESICRAQCSSNTGVGGGYIR